MKKRINILAIEDSCRNLSTFKEVAELNKTAREYRDILKSSIKHPNAQSKLYTYKLKYRHKPLFLLGWREPLVMHRSGQGLFLPHEPNVLD